MNLLWYDFYSTLFNKTNLELALAGETSASKVAPLSSLSSSYLHPSISSRYQRYVTCHPQRNFWRPSVTTVTICVCVCILYQAVNCIAGYICVKSLNFKIRIRTSLQDESVFEDDGKSKIS